MAVALRILRFPHIREPLQLDLRVELGERLVEVEIRTRARRRPRNDVEQMAFYYVPRPQIRGECAGVPRPCPWVTCQYHLYLDVNPETGVMRRNFPKLEVHKLKESCALDVADRHPEGATLAQVGVYINVTLERVRQIKEKALAQLLAEMELRTGESEAV